MITWLPFVLIDEEIQCSATHRRACRKPLFKPDLDFGTLWFPFLCSNYKPKSFSKEYLCRGLNKA